MIVYNYKKTYKIIAYIFFSYTLMGCSSKVVGIEKITSNNIIKNLYFISNTLSDRTYGSPFNQENQVITSKNELQKFIYNSKAGDIKEKNIVIKNILSKVDFKKDNILISSNYQSSQCSHNEKYIQRTPQQIDVIISIKKKGICYTAPKTYKFVYKVSKQIKKVGLKFFNYDYVIIEMK